MTRPAVRVRLSRSVTLLATTGAIAVLGTVLAPERRGPPSEHGVAIMLNIAGVGLSAQVSIR